MTKIFDYSAVNKYAKDLKNVQKELDQYFMQLLLQEGLEAIKDIKQRQDDVGAIDTGAMRQSWGLGREAFAIRGEGATSDTNVENSTVEVVTKVGKDFELDVWNSVEYASYVEYGTATTEGRYIMTMGIERVRQQLPVRAKIAFKEFCERHGI